LYDRESVAIGLLNLAMVAIERQRVEEAKPLLREALADTVATRSQLAGQAVLDVMSGFCAADGRHEDCARYFGAAEAQAVRSGLRRDGTDAEFLMPRIEHCRRTLGAEAFARAQADGAQWGYEEALRRAVAQMD